MNRLFYLFPVIVLLVAACSDKPVPQKTPEVTLPSYTQAAKDYQEKSKAEMEKMAPEDLAVMKRAGESLAQRLPDPGIKLGEKAPDFTLPDAFGKQVKLSELWRLVPFL